jgi:hypothetical protein
MSNPSLLLCDTDALIQLFLTKDLAQKLLPIRILKEDYRIQPVIVEEVEAELKWNGNHKDKFGHDITKALASGTIQLLDAAAFSIYSSSQYRETDVRVISSTWDAIRQDC